MGNCIPLFLGGENMPFYVPPDSVVKILRGVPIDYHRDNTLWFASQNAQLTYFNSKAVQTFTNVSYTRKGRGVIKLQVPCDTVFDCNYLMYQNTGFNNKWFYAFIMRVDYISNNVSQITFMIDQLQTWFFEMQLKQSFVVREHSTTDNIGDNILPEGLELGEYIYKDKVTRTWNTWSVFVASTFHGTLVDGQWQFEDVGGSYLGGVFSGLSFREFVIDTPAGAQNVVTYLSQAVSKGFKDGIVSIFMMPSYLYDYNGYGSNIPSQALQKMTTDIDGYVPKNKKLFTYPYCFIEVQNSTGTTGIFRQEFFSDQACEFIIESALSTNPSIACIPKNYKKLARNMSEAIYLNPALLCSYNADLFKAYMAQSLSYAVGGVAIDAVEKGVGGLANLSDNYVNSVIDEWNSQQTDENLMLPREEPSAAPFANSALKALNNLKTPLHMSLKDMADIATGTLATGGGLSEVYQALSQAYSYAVAPPHNIGNNNGDFLVSTRERGLWFFWRSITAKYAQIIDSYFTKYGYLTNEVKIPNIHARTYWTYTKTIDCDIEGNIPVEAKNEIKAIFNTGITFWADPSVVGDYSLNNSTL